jgi:ABC-2 type transport system ATP-binding protein
MEPAAEPPAIRFEGVEIDYGRHRVVDGLSLEIRRGEYFGLVGVNGAGKTTSIKGLLDFSEIRAGSIEIFGVSHKRTASRARLGFIPERLLPPYYLTGRDFLKYMARLYGVAFQEQGARELLRILDLDPGALDRPVRTFSKGMAQKLGLAACFSSAKELLVLDEPMSGLDPKARILVKRYLLGLKSQGRSLFFSTHMLNDVEDLCDRMAIMHEGRVHFAGTPAECRARYSASSLEDAFLSAIS